MDRKPLDPEIDMNQSLEVQQRLLDKIVVKGPGGQKFLMVACRRAGLTLRETADRAGVHVATVCRWQARDPTFAHDMREAADKARVEVWESRPTARPRVPWRKDCPVCRAKVVVRKTAAGVPFWRCGRTVCRWASWRPRHPRNCRRCGGPRFWSHSRKSVTCDHCRANSVTLTPQQKPP
ncbi:helix-turn-helix domain-containing protein [Fimbriiglobus ruber]|nr:helix-turn-helix domain-containing protein [Fimbriiglobus ruber]